MPVAGFLPAAGNTRHDGCLFVVVCDKLPKTCPNGQDLKFRLNSITVDIDPPADLTVLEYVRSQGLTGTKEGCASGDCGACTVMLGEDVQGEIRYRTVNACILPVGQLEGRQLLTVEGLADAGELHPAQQAMVDCHGSQCGFCTPGFVMSLACLVEEGVNADRENVLQGISGNLCRCTGYRPIVDAGMAALGMDGQLKGAAGTLPTAGGAGTHFFRPHDEASLQQLMAEHPGIRLIAGGTDLMLEVTQLYRDIDSLVDVSAVSTLRQVVKTEDDLIIGAAVPYTELEALSVSTAFNELLARLGSRQIRNAGTLGGNLANGSPIADTPPVLMAWDAQLEIVNSRGESREVAVENFYLGYRDTVLAPDEYIARIHIPLAAIDGFHRFYKSSKRLEDDISSVMGAFALQAKSGVIMQARIAYGGMAATPVRLQAVEQLLLGASIDDSLIEEVVQQVNQTLTPLTDVRASADYRLAMAGAMLGRALRAFSGADEPFVTELNLDD